MLTVKDLTDIHEILVDWFAASEDPISPPGIRDLNLLESAAGRPDQTVDGKDAYNGAFEKAAALFHSLVNNHAFHNGNKRIALAAGQAALAQESQWLDYCSDQEMLEFALRAAAHEITPNRSDEVSYIAEWFAANSRKIEKGEHPLKYGELKQILDRFGYSIDAPDGEFLGVYK